MNQEKKERPMKHDLTEEKKDADFKMQHNHRHQANYNNQQNYMGILLLGIAAIALRNNMRKMSQTLNVEVLQV